MFCSYCGKGLRTGAAFCRFCGRAQGHRDEMSIAATQAGPAGGLTRQDIIMIGSLLLFSLLLILIIALT